MKEKSRTVCNFMPGSSMTHIDGYDYGLHFVKMVQYIDGQWIADGRNVSMEELVEFCYAEKIERV